MWNLKIWTQEVVNVTNALGQISQYPAPLGLIMASRNGLMLDSWVGQQKVTRCDDILWMWDDVAV